jgi:hypothetical protein
MVSLLMSGDKSVRKENDLDRTMASFYTLSQQTR